MDAGKHSWLAATRQTRPTGTNPTLIRQLGAGNNNQDTVRISRLASSLCHQHTEVGAPTGRHDPQQDTHVAPSQCFLPPVTLLSRSTDSFAALPAPADALLAGAGDIAVPLPAVVVAATAAAGAGLAAGAGSAAGAGFAAGWTAAGAATAARVGAATAGVRPQKPFRAVPIVATLMSFESTPVGDWKKPVTAAAATKSKQHAAEKPKQNKWLCSAAA